MYLLYLAVDRAFLPSITSGTAAIEVPKVIGMQLDAAQKAIINRGLRIEVAKEVYNESVPLGSVVTQVPVAKSIVKEGRYIFVTISKGKELIAVPHIVGLNQRTAKINLMRVGLELGNTTYDFSDDIGKDTIISQSSKPGAKLPYGEYVHIVISKGSEKQIKIPSLIGLTLTEAMQLLKESDLILGTVEHKPDGTFLPDIVIKQFPLSGEIVQPESTVNVTITK
jgi:serine/threonine-protein kinase